MNDEDLALEIRKVAALAFVPPADVEHAFVNLVNNQNLDPRTRLIANYLEVQQSCL
ncbi:MAG: hypothetical protein GY820_32035 [Gammaproteobacteria bacterium]|nr:hypothetical protein [Gammaproteobacteria bacterium]